MHPFTWSWSRHQTWTACRRRYGYDYYLTRSARGSRASPAARELARLKGLRTVPQWLGLVAHDAAAALARGAPIEPTLDAVRAGARAELAAAQTGEGPGFVEDEAGPAADGAGRLTALDDLLAALIQHPLVRRLREVPGRVREVEQVHRFVVDGPRIAVSPDVVVQDEAGGLVIVDWKTGHHVDPRHHATQLALYAVHTVRRYRVPVGRTAALVATVRDGGFHRVPVDDAALSAAVALARRSAEEMASILPDPARDIAPIQAFPQLPPDHPACASCRYRPACRHDPDKFGPLMG